jgi:hypothetical protein
MTLSTPSTALKVALDIGEEPMVLKGRGFSRAVTALSPSAALATEGISAERYDLSNPALPGGLPC